MQLTSEQSQNFNLQLAYDIKQMASTTDNLIVDVIEQLCTLYGRDIIKSVLCTLAFFHEGLPDNALIAATVQLCVPPPSRPSLESTANELKMKARLERALPVLQQLLLDHDKRCVF